MDIVNEFGRVIGEARRSYTGEIIAGLSARRGNRNRNTVRGTVTTRYTDAIINIPALRCVLNADGNGGVITLNGVRDPIVRIAGGAYGTTFRGDSGNAYKRMVINPELLHRAEDIENYHREVYLEAYIQTVLQSDTTFGHNVARIQNMYRDEGVTRYRSNHTYYYKMERIPYNIDNILQRAGRTAEDNLNLITNLANILEYFDRAYSFRHRDLHANNILFTEDGSIKIIDFGLSCIIKDGINYAVLNTECASYDILILITYILEYNMMDNIAPQLNQLLSDGEVNLFTELSRRDRLPALFYMVYQFQIDDRRVYPWSDRAMRQRLITNIGEAKLRPDRLVEAWAQVRRNRAVGMAAAVPENNNANVQCDPFNPFSWCFRKRKTRGGKRRNRRRTLRK